MTSAHASPKDGRPTHDVVFVAQGQRWGVILDKGQAGYAIDERTTESSFSAIFARAGTKTAYGDDPALTMLEHREWTGGIGVRNYEDDATGYYDAQYAWTLSSGHVLPIPQWKYATGARSQDMYQLDTKCVWKNLIGTYISVAWSSSGFTATHVKLWIRKRGTPGTLTMNLCQDNAGSPGTVLATVTKAATDVTDTNMQLVDFAVNQALTGATTYHIFVYGATADSYANHWEVAVDDATTGSKTSPDGSTWTAAAFKMFYRVTDADADRRGYFFGFNSKWYYVTRPAAGSSVLYEWNTGTINWDAKTITGTALTAAVTGRPLVVNNFVYFPQGEATAILRMNTSFAGTADGTNMASLLCTYYDSAAGPQIVKSNYTAGTVCTIARATAVTTATNLTFGTAINCGNTNYPINSILFTDTGIFVFKSDGLGQIVNDRYTPLESQISNTPSSRNGTCSIFWNQIVYFPWLNTLMRKYGGNSEDIGLAYRGHGKPSGRMGAYVALQPTPGWLFCACDAGASGTSSVDIFDGLGWMEFYRAQGTGYRIRDVAWQPNDSGRDRIWIEQGADIVYIDMPLDVCSPLYDTAIKYHPECVIVFPTFDGSASRLPKYVRSFALSCSNFNGSGIRAEIDYQADGFIGTSTWTPAGMLVNSPEDEILVQLGNIRAIRFRMRMITDTLSTPPDVDAAVLEGFIRTPNRPVWNLRIRVGGTTKTGAKDHPSSDLLAWLRRMSQYPGGIVMESVFPELHNRHVIIAPPNVYRDFRSRVLGVWRGSMTISLMDVT
jgi:hypothetical protein